MIIEKNLYLQIGYHSKLFSMAERRREGGLKVSNLWIELQQWVLEISEK